MASRRVVYNLRPPALGELGLVECVRQLAQGYRHQLTVTVAEPDSMPPLPAAVEVAAFRIVQEGLNNVVIHANAQNCLIALQVAGGLRLEIVDDGDGISAAAVAGEGLASMKARCAELGGRCSISHRSPNGTRLIALLPLSSGE